MNEKSNIIIQNADGEVKPDPPIEIYRSELHGYWMVRWKGHEYATGWALSWPSGVVAHYIERTTGEKVEVKE